MTVFLREGTYYKDLSLCIDYKLIANGQTIQQKTVTYTGIELSDKIDFDRPTVDLKLIEQEIQLKQGGELQVLVLLKDKDGKILDKRMQQRTVPEVMSLEPNWPFTDRGNWRCLGHMQYGAEEGQELEMVVWAKSNPDRKTVVKLKEKDIFAQIKLVDGAFMPLDEICAELRDAKTKRVIGHAEKKIFTIR